MENNSITRSKSKSKSSSISNSSDKSTNINFSLSSSDNKDEIVEDNDNLIEDDYSDMFNSSLTCCDCDTSSEYKKFKAKKIKTLKSIIGYMDDPKHRPCDFKIPDDLYKDLLEIVKNIFSIKCKVQNLYNTIINPSCTNRRNNNNIDVLFRQLRMLLENALQEIERYTDKIIEIANAVIDKYMNRMCLIIKKIERTHCRNMIPLPLLLKDMRFVHTLVYLLNNKLKQPGELSETLSGREQLFGGACCVDIDENKCPVIDENECSDENQSILIKVMNKNFNADSLDLYMSSNYDSPNEKYCHDLVQQHNFIVTLKSEIYRAMMDTNLNSNLGVNIFIPKGTAGAFREVNPALTDVQIRNIEIELPYSDVRDFDPGDIHVALRGSDTYTKVRDSLFYHLQKLDKAPKFISKKLPIVLPCTFIGREHMNEKALIMYMELYRFNKYLISVLILKALIIQLKFEPDADAGYAPPANCKNVKDNIYRNILQHNNCLTHPGNIRYKFMNEIFQEIFGAFANDPRIALA